MYEKEINELFIRTIEGVNKIKQMELLIRRVGTINMALALCGFPKTEKHVYNNIHISSIKN